MQKALALLTAGILGLGLVAGVAQPAAAANTAYFVDCSAAQNGTGSQSSPWNSLSSVNNKQGGFGAGDAIYLKRDTTCQGSARPLGSGQSGSPITIDAYGSGALPKVVAPATAEYGIKLADQSYWTIQNLDVDGGTRYGVQVTVSSGVVSGITLRGLNVHDVTGGNMDSKDTGLVVVSTDVDAKNSTSGRFDGVLIEDVTAHDTTMWSGIIVGSAELGGEYEWVREDRSKRSTNVVVRNSTVYNTYGDGIILFVVDGGVIEHSVAHHTGIQPGPVTVGTPNAIWTWACDGCIIQYNEAYENDSPGVDGGAFDVDYYSDNTVVQYNYAHDNSAYCVAVFGAEGGVTTNTIIRYNVCANNGKQDVPQRTEVEVATWNGGSVNGLQIYNNTFVTNHGVINSPANAYSGSGARTFFNNVIYSTTANAAGKLESLDSDNNVWYYTGGPWSNNEAHSIYADPKLVNPTHTGNGDPGNAFTLLGDSPAIDAGRSIAGAGGRDYAGNAVPRGNATDIGADESGFSRNLSGLLSNGDFEAGSMAGWNGGSITTSGQRSGTYGAFLRGPNVGAYRTVTGLAPNTTYRYSAWVKVEPGNQGFLYVKNHGQSEVRSSAATSSTYTQLSVTFTTGAGVTSAELGLWRDAGAGSGYLWLDDASLATAASVSLLSNGGFESGTLTGWSSSSGAAVTTAGPRSGTYAAAQTGSSAGMYRTITGLSPNTTYTFTGWVKATSGNSGYLYAKIFGSAAVTSANATAAGYTQLTVTFTTGANNTSVEVGLWRDAGAGAGSVYLDDVSLT